jgi:hypothetical protein
VSTRRKETMIKPNGRGRRAELAVAAALGVVSVVNLPSSASAAGAGYNVLQSHAYGGILNRRNGSGRSGSKLTGAGSRSRGSA